MHEFGITERLFQVALEQAQLRDGERLRRLQISLDPDSGYAPDAIRFYFEQIAQGTPAQGAELAFVTSKQPQHIRLESVDIDSADMDVVSGNQSPIARWHIDVRGAVQGVGFRPFVHNLATELGLCGWVRNTSDGVEMELQGPEGELQHFHHHLKHDAPPLAHIFEIEIETHSPQPDAAADIRIRPSQPMQGRTLISPDVATCAHCLHELFDPQNRRFRYPFTNCTHCGPRFTIITEMPYDRPHTTMAGFELCPECAAEYEDARDRRFHAQPVACPECGPAIWFESERALVAAEDAALSAASEMLGEGGILAVKGVGGFHLACRADHGDAVERLRQHKVRPSKPLAIMVRNVDEAAIYCHLSVAEEQLLLSPEAPIVLLRKREHAGRSLAAEVAPANAYVGVVLPYTPLHHLLLQAADAPLVMTSGNRAGEPLCIDNDEARQQLHFADGFLLHNRPIARRCDDSVMLVAQTDAANITQSVRRSRGLAPLPILLPAELALERPLLAAGADLKNVSALAVDRHVFLSQHIGDLRNPNVRREQVRAVQELERLFHIAPAAVVCDKHPEYASARYANERATQEEIPCVEVQHHHAHIAACMAENQRTDTVIGLAFDGTGYGSDGHIWGGEALTANLTSFKRTCQLEYLPLPGGDAAIRQPSRIAYAYLRTLLPEVHSAPFLPALSPQECGLLNTMLAQRFNVPLSSSMGRLFDAVSALLGLCHHVTYEGEAAIALEAAAQLGHEGESGYPFFIESRFTGSRVVRLSPLFAGILTDRAAGSSVEAIARRFHHTVAEIAVAMAHAAQGATPNGPTTVALSGGVWQNRLLLEMTVPLLENAGFDVLLHRQIPANDGGIAYGQIAVAAARLAKNSALDGVSLDKGGESCV